jgi:hypothetical protein
MGEHRSVLVLFLEAAIKTAPLRWPNWHAGPLEVDGFNGKSQLPAGMWSAVAGGSGRSRRGCPSPSCHDSTGCAASGRIVPTTGLTSS